jgi:hypothetical protein
MHQDAPFFIILLSLTPDDFTRQELERKSAATQLVNALGSRILDMYNCLALR